MCKVQKIKLHIKCTLIQEILSIQNCIEVKLAHLRRSFVARKAGASSRHPPVAVPLLLEAARANVLKNMNVRVLNTIAMERFVLDGGIKRDGSCGAIVRVASARGGVTEKGREKVSSNTVK